MDVGYDGQRALGGFLRARRGRVTPEQAGIGGVAGGVGAAGGAGGIGRVGGVGNKRRRVQGLRREELAQLAGISVDYYVRLEQGRATQPSAEVLDALARALGLDAAERRHLDTLAAGRHEPVPATRIGPGLRRALDAMDRLPVFATDHRLGVVAWNRLGAALMGGLDVPGRRDPNNARFLFLDPAARDLHPDWEDRAAEAVGQLRVSAGRYPDDGELGALIAELAAGSGDFRRIWDSGEVTMCAAGRKRLRHPVVGLLELDFETLHVPAGPGESGLVLHVFSAAEGTAEAAALVRLT